MGATLAAKAINLKRRLSLRGNLVAMKFYEERSEAAQVAGVRWPKARLTTCQRITQARLYGVTVAAPMEDLPPFCSYITGLRDIPDTIADGSLVTGIWCQNQEDARKRQNAFPLVSDRFEAVLVAPLARDKFQPDLVLVYATPAHMMLLLNGLQYKDYEFLEFIHTGGSSCATSVARCYSTGKPSLAILDYGKRCYGHVAEDEISLALSPQYLEKAAEDLDFLAGAGLPHPILFFGAQADPTPGWPPTYIKLFEEEQS
ncbi:MAG: DUF169 domain-containing protein [Dehalococcoidia bacterium]|jgi:uncharacterized protein (DUF169 family)|nr:DUF169 domain-containing protein [Dehalococcoidia bacterium]